jgi:hypothetical protein
VCDGDPYCCTTAWDGICVTEADEQCGAGCTPPSTDGTCAGFFACASACGEANDACVLGCVDGTGPAALDDVYSVVTCLEDNGCYDAADPEAFNACAAASCSGELEACFGAVDDCCEPHDGPGCSNEAVKSCVCEADSYCCTVAWDSLCVDEADGCGAGCTTSADADCGGFFACTEPCEDEACVQACAAATDPEELQLASALVDCLEANGCYDETTPEAFNACAIAGCGPLLDACFASAAGDCCAPHDGPGCSVSAVEACVCTADPYCCTTAWDSLCVDAAGSTCGAACTTAGDCCEAHDAPGCADAAVEACVCGADPYCCATAWDDLCVSAAGDSCGGDCGGGDDASCVGHCGDDAPSGCWCDELCVGNGDCCEDACAACGQCG